MPSVERYCRHGDGNRSCRRERDVRLGGIAEKSRKSLRRLSGRRTRESNANNHQTTAKQRYSSHTIYWRRKITEPAQPQLEADFARTRSGFSTGGRRISCSTLGLFFFFTGSTFTGCPVSIER